MLSVYAPEGGQHVPATALTGRRTDARVGTPGDQKLTRNPAVMLCTL